jgi:hypothetical protein
MTAEDRLAGLRDDACHRAADPSGLGELIENTGRQRLAAHFLYSAMLAGVIGTDLAPARWPPELAEPFQRLGLTRFAPRTRRALDAQLTPAEQATRRSPGRGRRVVGARRLADRAIPEAVSMGVTLAVNLHPLGTAAGLGIRLIRSRIQAGRDQTYAFQRLGDDLRTLRAQADGELADQRTGRIGGRSV